MGIRDRIKSKVRGTRTFDGKHYWAGTWQYPKKSDAEKAASKYRSEGYYARIYYSPIKVWKDGKPHIGRSTGRHYPKGEVPYWGIYLREK